MEYTMTKHTRSIEDLIQKDDSPLPISAIPNQMGINLCSVHSVEWTETQGGQICEFTIRFIPAPEDEMKGTEKDFTFGMFGDVVKARTRDGRNST